MEVARRCSHGSSLDRSPFGQAICESEWPVKEREERSLIIPFLVASSPSLLFVSCDNGQRTLNEQPLGMYNKQNRQDQEYI